MTLARWRPTTEPIVIMCALTAASGRKAHRVTKSPASPNAAATSALASGQSTVATSSACSTPSRVTSSGVAPKSPATT